MARTSRTLGLDRVELASLSVNYRTPREVMAEAEPVIRAVLPDANIPTSIRSNGLPVVHGSTAELRSIRGRLARNALRGDRVRELASSSTWSCWSTPRFGIGIEGAVDRYVAMTRATQQLVVLTSA